MRIDGMAMLKHVTFAMAILLVWGGAASAVDGVVEINQAKAMAGNVTSGDAAGFPVTITESGSYRLTGNLTVTGGDPANTSAIQIQLQTGGNVTLDLNGFTVKGPTNCSGTPATCMPAGTGRGVDGTGIPNVAIRDGVVRGFPGGGVVLGSGARVEGVYGGGNGSVGIQVGSSSVVQHNTVSQAGGKGIDVGSGSTVTDNTADSCAQAGISASAGSVLANNTVSGNSQDGIDVGEGSTVRGNSARGNSANGISTGVGSVVIDNTASNNGGPGLLLGDGAGYGNNVLNGNNGGNNQAQVTGGIKLGSNVCGTILCP
jgi:parallel beta-helix repeat protein